MAELAADEGRWQHENFDEGRLDRASYASAIRELSRVRPYRAIVSLVSIWAVIGVAIAAAVLIDRWIVSLAAIIVIATRQHALGLIMHDGAHYRVLPSRFWNRW